MIILVMNLKQTHFLRKTHFLKGPFLITGMENTGVRIAYERNYMITVNYIIIFFILFTYELVYLKSNILVKGKHF